MPTDPYADIASPVASAPQADPYAAFSAPVNKPTPDQSQMMASHAPTPTMEGMSSHKGAAPFTSPIDQDVEILSKIIGPDKAYKAIRSSDYQPGMIAKLVQPDTGAVNYLNNLTGGMGSGARDVTLGQAQTVMKLLNKIGLTSDEQVALNEGLMGAREQGLQASGTPSFGRFVGNALTSFSPVSLAGKMAQVRAINEGLRSGKALQLAGSGGLMGMAGAAVQPNATPESVATGGVAGSILTPAAEKVIIPAVKGAWAGAKKFGNAIMSEGENFAPEAVTNWFKDRVPGKASDVLQEDLMAQYAAARKRGSAPFQELRTQDGTVSMQPYIDKVEQAIGEVQKSGFSDKEPIIQQLTALKKTAQEGPMTWGKAMDIGTDINDKISQAMSGQNPDRNLARILQPIKTAHQEALDSAGAQFGDKYKAAKQAWIENVVPWEDPKQGGRLLKNFMNSPTPDQAMSALLKAKSEDKINIFLDQLSKDKGIPALQAGLAESVYQQSLDESGKVIPSKFLGALKARQDAYDLAFSGEAKWRMDGLATLLKDSKFTAQFLTGEWLRHVPGGRILPGSAYPTPDAGSLIQKIFTSPTGSKFLVQARDLKPNTPQMDTLINRSMPKIINSMVAPSTSAPNVMPLRTALPAAASTGTSDQIAQTEPK